jgi:hypothetical protein
MRSRWWIVAGALVAVALVASLLVGPAPMAKAHGTCGITTSISPDSSFAGPNVRGYVRRACSEGHARLRMAFWIQFKCNNCTSWANQSDVGIAECRQCRNQLNSVSSGANACKEWGVWRVHVESALIFNSSGEDVTSNHVQSPDPPFNGPATQLNCV